MGIPTRRGGGGGGGGVVGVDMLSERAAQMREALVKSQSITDNMVSILGSFDHRLSALETAMRPTQIRTHAIRRAHENIDKTLKAAEVILSQFDISRQAESKILKGPHEDLESYLQAIDQLRKNIQFFSNNKSFKSSDGVLNHTNNLLAKAISKLEEEFKQLLSSYRSEAKDLLGDDWVQRHRRIVQQHANQYKRIAWAKILQCLSVQGLTSSGGGSAVSADGGNSSGVSRAIIKDRLKTFNIQFEELHQRQSQWTVPDTELRESLRLAVAEVLLPAYRSFIKRFGPLVENGKNPQKYIRYTPEDLEHMLGEFFEGKTLNEPKR
ncbi:UNVERIFIED_CONTAM: Exocyst complex component EXO70A1 [Sesamum radiatum]|uniref:Exocyst subunit Exo70 family protein n=1 Tax=Sesamum radiatum TaxID=300843 RepID=A0AAW2JXB2_SESRA